MTGLIALWLVLRIPRTARKRSAALSLVVLALLGIGPAAIDLDLSQDALRGAAELIACYGVALGVVIALWAASRSTEAGAAGKAESVISHRLGLRRSRRTRLATLSAVGACATIGLLVCAYRYPVWFFGGSVLLTVLAAALLVAVGAVGCRAARALAVPDEPNTAASFRYGSGSAASLRW